MMIGGGSRGKDRDQWDGWGLEEPSKRPASPRSMSFDEVFSTNLSFGQLFSVNLPAPIVFRNSQHIYSFIVQ